MPGRVDDEEDIYTFTLQSRAGKFPVFPHVIRAELKTRSIKFIPGYVEESVAVVIVTCL